MRLRHGKAVVAVERDGHDMPVLGKPLTDEFRHAGFIFDHQNTHGPTSMVRRDSENWL
jgi:hypothetical protein